MYTEDVNNDKIIIKSTVRIDTLLASDVTKLNAEAQGFQRNLLEVLTIPLLYLRLSLLSQLNAKTYLQSVKWVVRMD
jgi:hypothetical protein